MNNRYLLTEYTEAEIRALPAGPLLDWLALLGLGYVAITARRGACRIWLFRPGTCNVVGYWLRDESEPWISDHFANPDCMVSRDPGAAMRALLALAEAMAIDAVMLQVWFKDDEWELDAAKANGGDCSMREGGPNFPTLIAQACALWGLHKAKEDDANG